MKNELVAADRDLDGLVVSRPEFGSTVSIAGLTKEFGGVRAVDDVSLDIASGEFVSLLGPSGSGKTTILMMLAGFELPTQGKIWIADRDVTGVPPFKRDIGMVFQSYALFPHMTVFENIAYPLKLRRMSKADIQERVVWAMDLVRLPISQFADRFPLQLSGGQRQRVALVRALVYEPRVVLMDEPMGALDKNLREELKLELMALQQRLRLTIVYVTHDQGEALMLSDRVVVLRNGQIEQIDPPEVLYKRPKTAFVANFLGEANLLKVNRISETDFQLSNGVSINVCPTTASAAGSEQWLYLVRPEDIAAVDDAHATISGRVESSVYLGSSSRISVDTEIGRLTMITKVSDASRMRPGMRIGLQFVQDEPVIVPA